jgi:hypothetical protein
MVRSQMLTKEELFARYGRGEALHAVYINDLQLLRAQIKVTTQLWNILGNAGTVMWSVLAATSLTIFAELSCTTGF